MNLGKELQGLVLNISSLVETITAIQEHVDHSIEHLPAASDRLDKITGETESATNHLIDIADALSNSDAEAAAILNELAGWSTGSGRGPSTLISSNGSRVEGHYQPDLGIRHCLVVIRNSGNGTNVEQLLCCTVVVGKDHEVVLEVNRPHRQRDRLVTSPAATSNVLDRTAGRLCSGCRLLR